MANVSVDEEFCKGCGLCVDACPLDLMQLNEKVITSKGYHPAYCSDMEKCNGCTSCAIMCPDVAIEISR